MPRYYRRRRPYSRRSRYGLRKMKVYQSPSTSFRKMSYDAMKMVQPGINTGFIPNWHFMIRANSIYDPDASAGGETAIGYESAAAGFNHYTVYAARITIHWTPYSSKGAEYAIGMNEGNGIPIWVGVGLVADQTALTQDYKTLSQDHTWSWDLMTLQNAAFGQPSGWKSYTQTKWFNAKTYFNTSSPKDVESISAPFGTNPVDMAYFGVATIATHAKVFAPEATDFGMWTAHYHVEFWVDLQEPKYQGVAR